jgi:hypothetical protein
VIEIPEETDDISKEKVCLVLRIVFQLLQWYLDTRSIGNYRSG